MGLVGVGLLLVHPLLLGGVLFRRDIHLLWEANHDAFVRAVSAGAWPLWDDALGFGRTLLGNPQSLVLYPPHWLSLLLPFPAYCTAFVVLHVAWGSAGAFVLARRLGQSTVAAGLAAAVFVASGPFVSSFEMLSLLAGAAWMPWTVVAALGLARDPTPWRAVVCGLAGAGQILAGSPDVALMAASGAGVAWVAEVWATRRAAAGPWLDRRLLGSVALAASVALGLTAAQWLTALETVRASGRGEMATEVREYWSLHPLAASEALLPVRVSAWPLTAEARGVLFESREPLLSSVYLGLPALALVLVAARRRRGLAALLLALLLLAVLVALGRHTPILESAAAVLPPVRALRFPVKAMLLAPLVWGLLTGLGFDAWTREPGPRRGIVIGLGSLAVVALGLALAAPSLLTGAVGPWLAPVDEGARAALSTPLKARLLFAAAAFALAAVAWGPVSPRVRSAAALVVACAAVGELALPHSALNPVAPPDFYAYRSPLNDPLSGGPAGRTYVYDYYGTRGKSEEHLGRSNPYTPHPGLPHGELTGAIMLRAYLMPGTAVPRGVRYAYDLDVARLDSREGARLNQLVRVAEGTPAHRRLLEMGAVGHVVALHDLAPDGLAPATELAEVFVEPIGLWRVPDPLPRVLVVGGTRVGAGLEGARRLLEDDFDPRREVLLEEGEERGAPLFDGAAEIVEERPGALVVEVRLSHPGHLVVLDSHAPGWQAHVAGRPSAVARANQAFRAVALPAGSHRVELRYRPRGLVLGLLAAVVALALALGTALARRGRVHTP